MGDKSMDRRKERELEQLVSAICDDGASAQDLQALELLLADDPELQDRYCEMVSTHIALGVAVSGAVEGQLLRPTADAPLNQNSVRSLLRPPLRSESQLRFFYYAAAVLLLSLGIVVWSVGPGWLVALNDRSDDQPINWTVDRIPTITRVSWDGPTFSRESDQRQLIDGGEAGPVSLKVKQGPSANGYLFCLPPGAAVELIATFDATGENCLSVVELVANDRQPVEKATFNNCGIGPKPWDANPTVNNRRYGVLGRWFEHNTGRSLRYFLLTGSHKLANPKPDQDWQLSEMAVLLERDGVVQIGWDDSGPAPPAQGKAYHRDDDFDDLAATLILSSPNPRGTIEGAVDFIGEDRGFVEGAVPPARDGWRISLAPGEMAVIKAASQASAPNALFLLDAETNSIYWSSSNTSASDKLAESRDLGAVAIKNSSATSQEFLLFAAHRKIDDGEPAKEWHESLRKTFFEQPGYAILGFEDFRRDDDFDDVRVSILQVDSADMRQSPVDVTSHRIH